MQPQPLHRAPQGLREALVVEGLEQVIDGLDVEGAHRMVIVGGDEDHRRRPGGPQRGQQIEAVLPGQLHVEKEQVDRLAAQRSQRVRQIRALVHQDDRRLAREQGAQAETGRRLVLDYGGAHRFSHEGPRAAEPPPPPARLRREPL